MSARRVTPLWSWFVGALILCAVAVVLILPELNLGWIAAQRASAMTGRRVEVRVLRISAGHPIAIHLEGATLGSIAGGGAPELGRLETLSAELDLWPLLRGQVRFRRVAIDGLTVALERTADGTGNWKVAGPGEPAGRDNPRASLPTMLELSVANVRVTMRTTGGNLLRIVGNSVHLETEGETAPIRLVADGAYNDTPLRIAATMDSFAKLHDLATPFGVTMTTRAPVSTLTFSGTLMDPLGADGVDGVLRGDFARLDDVLAVSGTSLRMNIPMTIAGPITRLGDAWDWRALTGVFAGAPYTGRIELAEGGHGRPDRFTVAVDIAALQADTLIASVSFADGATLSAGGARLEVDGAPSTLLEARLGSRLVTWRQIELAELGLFLTIAPGKVALSDLVMGLAGGRVSGAVVAVPGGDGVGITSHAEMAGVEVGALLRMAGAGARAVSGRADARVALVLRGTTLDQAIASATGAGALTIAGGQVSRKLVHQASIDLGLIFDDKAGMIPVQCFLVVASAHEGIVTVAPLRLQTQEGTIVGAGTVDLAQASVALTVQTLSETTGFLSLDLPIAITGRLASPDIRQGSGDATGALVAQGAANLRRLPPEIAAVAAGNGCAR